MNSKKQSRGPRPQYIWDTYGDWHATLVEGHLWDLTGNWIGWVENGTDVYKADGEWIGALTRDFRIVQKRSARRRPLHEHIPAKPPRPELPARATLPPSFVELAYSEVDVLIEDPAIFRKLSDFRKDMGEK